MLRQLPPRIGNNGLHGHASRANRISESRALEFMSQKMLLSDVSLIRVHRPRVTRAHVHFKRRVSQQSFLTIRLTHDVLCVGCLVAVLAMTM